MIRLIDVADDSELGTITEEQLAALVDALEEESEDDDSYYVDEATVDMLEDAGADAGLVGLLRSALTGRDELDVRWERD